MAEGDRESGFSTSVFDGRLMRLTEPFIPQFIDTIVGWRSLPTAERKLARSILAAAMEWPGAKKGGANEPDELAPIHARPIAKNFIQKVQKPELRRDLLRCWLSKQDAWRKALHPWAESRGLSVWNPNDEASPPRSPLSAEDLALAAREAPGLPDNLDEEQRMCLLARLLRGAPVVDPPVGEALPDRLMRWLGELETLPLDAPDWGFLDDFRTRAGATRQRRENEEHGRRAAAEAKLREQLEVVLGRLASAENRARLQSIHRNYLESRLSWSADAFNRDAGERALALLGELEEAFRLVDGLAFTKDSTREEYQRRRIAQDAFEESFCTLCDRLDALKADGHSPSASSNSPTMVGPAVATATAADAHTEATPKPHTTTASPDTEPEGTLGVESDPADQVRASKAIASSNEVSPRLASPRPFLSGGAAPHALSLEPPEPTSSTPAEIPGPGSSMGAVQVAVEDAPSAPRSPAISVSKEAVSEDTSSTTEASAGVAPPTVSTPQATQASESQKAGLSGEAHQPNPEVTHLRQKLIPLSEAALKVVADPTSNEASESLLRAFLVEGDFAAAYWVARGCSARGEVSAIPLPILAGITGAFALPGEGGEALSAGLLELVTAHPIESTAGFSTHVLSLSAAVRAAEAPNTGMRAWLVSEEVSPKLGALTGALKAFADRGIRLPREASQRPLQARELAQRRKVASREVQLWMGKAGGFTAQYGQATVVWGQLLSRPITELLRIPMNDLVDQSEALGRLLQGFATESSRKEHITAAEKALKVPREIVGSALRKLLRDTEDAYRLAAQWHEAVTQEQAQARAGVRGQSVIEQLRATVTDELDPVLAVLHDLTKRTDDALDQASLAVLKDSLSWLAWRLGVRQTIPPRSSAVQLAARVVDPERSLDSVLAQRLKLLPWLKLPTERGASWDEALPAVSETLAKEVLAPHSLVEVIQAWVERGDYRFVKELTQRIEGPEAREAVETRIAAAKRARQESLKRSVTKMEAEIEQAYIEGVIGNERAEYLDETKALRSRFESDERFDIAEGRLENIRQKTADARLALVNNYRAQWDQIRRQLQGRQLDVSLAGARIDEAVTRGDIRTTDELLSHLRQVAEGGTFNPDLFSAPKSDTTLEQFLNHLSVYEREIGKVNGREVLQRLDACNEPTPSGAKQELKKAIDSFWKLKDAAQAPQRVPQYILDLLSYVGFGVLSTPTFASAVKGGSAFKAQLDSKKKSPVPEFGSKLEQRQCDVYCCWERPGTSALNELLAHLPHTEHPRIVIYAGRLNGPQRQKLRVETRKGAHAVIVLDEWLLCFLERYAASDRMGAFLATTLPWTSINPYVPRSVAMPPEMFFGRDEMARALSDQRGPYIVYGGRQLGKSALLEQVQHRFSNKREGQFAVRLDIKAIGDPAAADRSTKLLFARLRDELKQAGFLSAQVTSDVPESVLGNILGVLEDKKYRLLVLLDEADNFLDADSQRGFEHIVLLRDKMLKSRGSLKVVLAGLHNVQRFQAHPNQPFAQLGAALLVGPLEPSAALSLIRRPFEALGFRFKEGEGPLQHILSFTNYHPGLIQLFCQKLLQQLQQRSDNIHLPFIISEQDVEEVYRQREVQEGIAERFQWTLALDSRYRALVYALVLKQDADDVGHSKPLSVGEFLKEGQYWWKQAFDRLRTEEVRGLLEEMVGLGVLVPAGPNRYRLRSPNVVRLLGSTEDVERNLQELADEPPPVAFLPDHQHEWLDQSEPRKVVASPFTIAQERQIRGDASGLMLVTGSEATGLADVPRALEHMVGQSAEGKPRNLYSAPPATIENGTQFVAWLRDEQSRAPKYVDRLIVHMRLTEAAAATGDVVHAALEHLGRLKQGRLTTRVILSMGPLATWRWVLNGSRTSVDVSGVPALSLRRWTKEGVRRLLSEVAIPHDERSVERVVGSTTGGWLPLLREFTRTSEHESANVTCERIERDFANGGRLADALWSTLGVGDIPEVGVILRTLHEVDCPFDNADQVLSLLSPSDASSMGPRVGAVVELLERLDMLEPVVTSSSGTQRQLAPLVGRVLPQPGL